MLLLLLACSLKPGGGSPHDDSSAPDDSAPPTDSELPSICPSGLQASDEVVLWTASDSAISFVDGTGASRDVFSFATSEHTVARAQHAGDRVGVLVTAAYSAELGLLAMDGSLLSRTTIEQAYTSDYWVGADHVTYSPGFEDFDARNPWMDGIVLASDGATVLDGWIPKGPVVDGVLPVCAVDESACAWLELSTAKASGSFPYDAWWTGSHLVWIDAAELVVATREDEQRVDLGADTVVDWNADAALIGSMASPSAIVSLATGDAIPVGALPDGWRAFTDPSPHNYCPNQDWNLSTDGRVLAVLRNDEVAQVWAHDPSTGSWEVVGSPLADVVYVRVWEQAGTVEIAGVDPSETFCPWQTFDPTSDALLGSTIQVVRPADGIHWVDPEWADYFVGWGEHIPPASLHSSGTCALSYPGDAVVDLLTEDTVALSANVGGWLD